MTALRELFGVFGDPIDHSLSPDIQAAAFAVLNKAAAYLPFRVEPGRLPEAFAAARVLGMRGFNVTIPHKEQAAELVDSLEGDAAAIRTVNVVARRGEQLVGFNTDTLAVRQAVKRAGCDLSGQKALVLGAGGAARAAAFALGKAGAAEVIISNRTFARAQAIAEQLAELGIDAVAAPYSAGALRELVPMCRAVVNATSVGLKAPDQSPLPDGVLFDADAVAIDMVYRPLKTRFLRQAREQATGIDGLEILIEQAIGSLAIWLERPADAQRLATRMRAAALEAML